MLRCRCIKTDSAKSFIEGKEYFLNTKKCYKDPNGDIIGAIYSTNDNNNFIKFSLYNKYFVPRYYTNKTLYCNNT